MSNERARMAFAPPINTGAPATINVAANIATLRSLGADVKFSAAAPAANKAPAAAVLRALRLRARDTGCAPLSPDPPDIAAAHAGQSAAAVCFSSFAIIRAPTCYI
jgi:hypothetical protein